MEPLESPQLDQTLMRRALAALGERCRERTDVVIVGGAAAVLCRWLRRTTGDIDVIDADPRLATMRSMIASVADDLRLSDTWLNDGAEPFAQVLPRDYHGRLVDVGTFGMLHVRAISRQDFILLKLYAFRDTDFEDLQSLQPPPTADEVAFVRAQLPRIAGFDQKKALHLQLYLDQGEASAEETGSRSTI